MTEITTIVLIFTVQNIIWMAIVIYLACKPSSQFRGFSERLIAGETLSELTTLTAHSSYTPTVTTGVLQEDLPPVRYGTVGAVAEPITPADKTIHTKDEPDK